MEKTIHKFLSLCYGTSYYTVSVRYYDFEHLADPILMSEYGIPSTIYCRLTNSVGFKFNDKVLIYKKEGNLKIPEESLDKLNVWFPDVSKQLLTTIVCNWFYECKSCGYDNISTYVL
jgi:hypothetical protein